MATVTNHDLKNFPIIFRVSNISPGYWNFLIRTIKTKQFTISVTQKISKLTNLMPALYFLFIKMVINLISFNKLKKICIQKYKWWLNYNQKINSVLFPGFFTASKNSRFLGQMATLIMTWNHLSLSDINYDWLWIGDCISIAS